MINTTRYFMALIFVVFMSSCTTSLDEEGDITTCATSSTCSEIEHGTDANLNFESGDFTYDNQEDFATFYHQLMGDEVTVPTVIFSNQIVIVVVMGQRASGCYAIRINEVEMGEAQALVHVTNYIPQGSETCSQAYVNPYYIATIPSTDLAIEFEYAEGDINDL